MNYCYHVSSYFIGMSKGEDLNSKKIAKITIHTNSFFRYLKAYWAMKCRHTYIAIKDRNSYEFR